MGSAGLADARINWRDLDLPPGHPGSREKIEKILAQKPRHWLEWYEGRFRNNEGGPWIFVPCQLTHDQVREINAMIHVENELIDEACGRVMKRIAERGWDAQTDVFFTTDHGELQGDFGLLYKGPYHVDALMRVPLIWRPAPIANMQAGRDSRSGRAISISRRHFARSRACRCLIGCRASRCR